ncbi:MAG: bifunctional riboflavin kinase/FAD synthetase [Tissierellia bacterium]|jgi:riboflavin kinase/FMN adenylyltransferase|nr:bifunctional riboflavin kinase/FAD synthetase [Bacillota bacterium]NLK59266.1 bifunctional riboflavin kinase/FAD synthetase [Tissierellia bacterium]
MIIVDLDSLQISKENAIVALGNFDGMHRGHQKLFQIAVQEHRTKGITPSVLLFKTHTREAFRAHYKQLQSLQDKIETAARFGIEKVFLLSFTEQILRLSPEAFVDQILIQYCNASALVAGTNYTFGYRARGDVLRLSDIAKSRRLDLHIAPEITHNGVMINSTMIRAAVHAGDIRKAAVLLGQPYQIRGIVGPGRRRGRHLGFPTANLQLQFPYCLPPDGVYFTWITIDDTRHPSLTNIGNNPTFEGAERKIETYVMDFSGDLYDREVRLDFVEYFRPDMRFDNKEELIAQMQRDENEARRLLIEMPLHKRI